MITFSSCVLLGLAASRAGLASVWKKLKIKCPDMTNGTDLRRLPHLWHVLSVHYQVSYRNFRKNYALKFHILNSTESSVPQFSWQSCVLALSRGEIQTLSVTFTLRTSLKDVRGPYDRTSGDIPTGCPAMFYFCIFTWYLCTLCIYMNSEEVSDSCGRITCL